MLDGLPPQEFEWLDKALIGEDVQEQVAAAERLRDQWFVAKVGADRVSMRAVHEIPLWPRQDTH